MGFFDDEKNVESYVKMAEGYDGRWLITILQKYVPPGATVLELGMGPGKDYEILSETFRVTGSDYSQVFLDRYRKIAPNADLLLLDAVTMNTNRRFDAIYSNKVLHHLTKSDFKRSLENQADVLNKNGIVFHSLWYGDKEEEHVGLRFVYYTEDTFRALIGPEFEIVTTGRYGEMEEDDSFYFVLRKLMNQ